MVSLVGGGGLDELVDSHRAGDGTGVQVEGITDDEDDDKDDTTSSSSVNPCPLGRFG